MWLLHHYKYPTVSPQWRAESHSEREHHRRLPGAVLTTPNVNFRLPETTETNRHCSTIKHSTTSFHNSWPVLTQRVLSSTQVHRKYVWGSRHLIWVRSLLGRAKSNRGVTVQQVRLWTPRDQPKVCLWAHTAQRSHRLSSTSLSIWKIIYWHIYGVYKTLGTPALPWQTAQVNLGESYSTLLMSLVQSTSISLDEVEETG